MRVTFEPAARDELDNIYSWIAKDSPRAAHEYDRPNRGEGHAAGNSELTHMGRPGLVEGTRELLEYPYIIVYQVHDDRGEVVVLSIVHGAQDREREGS